MKVRTLESCEKTPESPLFYCEPGCVPVREQLFAEFTVVYPVLGALSTAILRSIIHLTKVRGVYKVISGGRANYISKYPVPF